MPLLRFQCPECDQKKSKLVQDLTKVKDFVLNCPECGNQMAREKVDSFTIVKETIDNGIMERRVEQNANAPELVEERAQSGIKKKNHNSL